MALMMQQPQGRFGGMFQQGGMFGPGSAGNQGLMNFGLGTLQANAQGQGFGRSALAGLGSGMGAFTGAKQNQAQGAERDKLMQALMGRMGGVADRAGGGMGGIGGPPPGAPTDGPNPNSIIGGMFPRGQPQMQPGMGGGMPQGPQGLGMFPQQPQMPGGMFPPQRGMGGMY
jgi:hypothetical protein